MGTVIIFEGRYHFGNNPGVFQNAEYVGLQLQLPVSVPWLDDKADAYTFHVFTRDVESWTGGGEKPLGHLVSLGKLEIGRLRDPDNVQGRTEHFKLKVPGDGVRAELGQIPATTALTIQIEPTMAGPLADDFVLLRAETSENIVVRLGIG